MEFARRTLCKGVDNDNDLFSPSPSVFKYTADGRSPNRLRKRSSTPCVISGWCQCIFCERVKNIFEDVRAGAPIKFVSFSNARSRPVYISRDAIRIEMTFLPRNFSLVFLLPSFSYRKCTFDLISLTLVLAFRSSLLQRNVYQRFLLSFDERDEISIAR